MVGDVSSTGDERSVLDISMGVNTVLESISISVDEGFWISNSSCQLRSSLADNTEEVSKSPLTNSTESTGSFTSWSILTFFVRLLILCFTIVLGSWETVPCFPTLSLDAADISFIRAPFCSSYSHILCGSLDSS